MMKTELIDGLKRRKLGSFDSPTVILVQNQKNRSVSAPALTQTLVILPSSLPITGQTAPASLVSDEETNILLSLWLKVLDLLPQHSLGFPDYSGTPIRHLERTIDRAARALGHSLPTATTFRKHEQAN